MSNDNKDLSQKNIEELYNKYNELIKFEVKELGCQPTEVRHLIGRLGEFFCAMKVGGTLAHEVNQHGFDVIDKNNRKISVKTTAQKSGFTRINKNNFEEVDDLMFLQHDNDEILILYYGSTKNIESYIRKGKHWELDISKAKKANNELLALS